MNSASSPGRALTDLHSSKALGICVALSDWRRARRLKQSHVAELLGVSQTTMSRWETGMRLPDPESQGKIAALIEAGLDSAADRELGRLVATSTRPVHLVCDFTHRLLALSPARARESRVDPTDLIGVSLWRFATQDIARAEGALEGYGWFEPAPPSFTDITQANSGDDDLIIPASRYRWTRMRLSDGRFVRLVETLDG